MYNFERFREELKANGYDVSEYSNDDLQTMIEELPIIWEDKKEYKSSYCFDDEEKKEKVYRETKRFVKGFLKKVGIDEITFAEIRESAIGEW